MPSFNPDAYPWAACVPEILVSSFAKSLAFYRTLGFADMYQRKDFAYLDYQGGQIMIAQRDGRWETGTMEHPYGRGVNFQFATDEMDALLQRIEEARIKLYEAKIEKWRDLGGHKSGSVEFLVQDPDGYLLRFLQDVA